MSRESASNLVCFLLGAAVGAGVALLYAPQEGSRTRRALSEKASEVKEKAQELSHTARERWDGLSAKAQELLHREHPPSVEPADASENAHA